MKLNNKRGISLIVLVITIIVMIILGAAIILSLSSNGIIGKANDATRKTDLANAKQVVALAIGEWDLGAVDENYTLKEYAEEKLEETGFSVGEKKAGSYHVSSKGELYRYPVIPKGFVVSNISSEQTIEDGLVIYEIPEAERSSVSWTSKDGYGNTSYLDVQEQYNQYVWVPVPEINDFVRVNWSNSTTFRDNNTEPCIAGYSAIQNKTITLSETNDLTGEWAEYKKMKASVEKYGGFYIARYEAGTTNIRTNTGGTSYKEDGITPDVVFKKDKNPYNYVGWGPEMVTVIGNVIEEKKDSGIGAVELSRGIYPESANKEVVSTLIYGVQWDAIMNFMKDVQNPNGIKSKYYIYDSEEMGWYDDNESGNSNYITGKDIDNNASNMVKNIYDIAGNIKEWTMEANKKYYRVLRGAEYAVTGTSCPASSRYNYSYGQHAKGFGFRVALYIK